jgi:hypothetical protein
VNQYPQWGDGSNSRMLGEIGGQYEPTQDHDVRHLLQSSLENIIIISMVIWLIKRMFCRPLASLVCIGALIAVTAISVHEQHFYPLVWVPLTIALIAFGRVVR